MRVTVAALIPAALPGHHTPRDQERTYTVEPRCKLQVRPESKRAQIGQLRNCREAHAQREGDLP